MRKTRNILTEAQRLELIRRYLTENTTQKEFAEYYNVDVRTIRRVVQGVKRYGLYRDWRQEGREYREYDKDSGEPDDPNDFWRHDNYRDSPYDDAVLIRPPRIPHNRHQARREFSIDWNGDFKDE